jgi:UDP-perosamine 4-acetyltransferase
VAPGAVLSGGVEVGEETLLGAGSTVRQGIRIGRQVIVGAGAVVVRPLADGVTAIGVPARGREK